MRILDDAHREGLRPPPGRRPSAPAVHHDLTLLAERSGLDIDPELLAIGIHLWISLVGTIGFLLHGHLHSVIEDQDAFPSTIDQLVDELVGVGTEPVVGARRTGMTKHTPHLHAAVSRTGFTRRHLLRRGRRPRDRPPARRVRRPDEGGPVHLADRRSDRRREHARCDGAAGHRCLRGDRRNPTDPATTVLSNT